MVCTLVVYVALLLAFKCCTVVKICNMKQLINDWQCQQSFVDDAVLIPKLNHKTALHHGGPVNPASGSEQANVLSETFKSVVFV